MLWESLNKDLVFIDLEVATYEDVFNVLGKKLIELGYCKESYIQALKDREFVYPTGLDVDGIGVAIPHTDAEYVYNTAISIAKLKNPVKFHGMATNPSDNIMVDVNLVIMLAVNDGKHIEFLQRAICILQDHELLKKIVNAKTSCEMIDLIKGGEKDENL